MRYSLFFLVFSLQLLVAAPKPDCTGALSRAAKNQKLAERIGLVYGFDTTTALERVGEGKDTSFIDANGTPVSDTQTFDRIRSLGIPPGYREVKVSANAHTHIQAIAKDKKGRDQYRYHPKWNEAKSEEKFSRVSAFGKALPALREQVANDLENPSLSKERVVAAVVRLLDKTQIRIGSAEYAEENDTYGLTTLQPGHVAIQGDTVKLRFKGKSGVSHDVTVTDPEVAKVLAETLKLGTQNVFVSNNGQAITAADVNDYLKAKSGAAITAKDFRTWAGTLEAFKVYRARSNLEDSKSRKATLREIALTASQTLRNEPSTALKHYVHPKIVRMIEQGALYRSASSPESALLQFLDE